MGYPMHYDNAAQIMDEIAKLTPTFTGVSYDKIDRLRGMEITICTTARTDEEARALLRGLGMPFRTAS